MKKKNLFLGLASTVVMAISAQQPVRPTMFNQKHIVLATKATPEQQQQLQQALASRKEERQQTSPDVANKHYYEQLERILNNTQKQQLFATVINEDRLWIKSKSCV